MPAPGASDDSSSPSPSLGKPVLVDMHMSYYSARPRFALYLKELEDEIDIKVPEDYGGLKSPTYLALNPQGKFPLFLLADGTAVPESEVITAYILDRYSDRGASLKVSTVDGRLVENLIKRLCDIYVCPLISSLYLTMDIELRAKNLVELRRQLLLLDTYLKASPYAAGEDMSSADIALFPVCVFLRTMTSMAYGWENLFKDCEKFPVWWEHMNKNPVAKRLREEIETHAAAVVKSGWLDSTGAAEHAKNAKYDWKLC